MRWRGWLLLIGGMAILSCRFSPLQGRDAVATEAGVTAAATAAPPALSPGQELSEVLKDLVLTPEDLPVESEYYLAQPGDSRPFHNTDVVASWGGLSGWEYLQATGRVDGYFADYLRGSEIASGPEEFFCNVTVFTTAEGARLSLTDYNLVANAEPDESQWTFGENPDLELGDLYLILTSQVSQPGVGDRAWYRIEFSYKNYVGVVAGFGAEDEVPQDFIEEAARALLAKIEAAPLTEP